MADTVTLDDDPDSLRRSDLRAKIAVAVGYRPNKHSKLRKSVLNSVYAYLTGEFCYPRPARYHRDHPGYCSRQEVLFAVVIEAGIGEPQDDWSASLEQCPNQLRRDELLTLARVLKDQEDRRSWVGGD